MGKTRKKSFTLDELVSFFDLKKVAQCEPLDEWLAAKYNLNELETTILKRKHREMVLEGDYWNEEELKIRFIAFLLDIAAIDVKNTIKVFFERPLKATIDKKDLSVVCDCMVATPIGFNTPNEPYFFLQEFKKGKGNPHDPEAQTLAAMLIAQQKNKKDLPLYGSWVIGRHWFFAILKEKEYCVGKSFDATQWEDISQIVFILRHLKDLILKQIKE